MYKPRKCIICGDTFIPESGRQKCCGKAIVKVCEVCGREYLGHCTTQDDSHTCGSRECRLEYTRRVKMANCLTQTRICRICGKEFHPLSPTQTVCNAPHYRKCIVCGKEFEVSRVNGNELSSAVTCSAECEKINRNREIKAALARKPEGYNKHKQVHTRICKWCGKEFTTTEPKKIYCDGIHTRNCVICGKRFIVDNKLLSSLVLPKTCSEECRLKLIERTTIERYGVANYTQTAEYKDKLSANLDSIAAKRKATMMAKYGIDSMSKSDNWLINTMADPSKLDGYKLFRDSPREFIAATFQQTAPTISMLASAIGVNDSSTLNWVHKYGIEDLVNIQYSSIEVEVEAFLKSVDRELEIIHNDRNVIKPMEVDLYLPDYKVGIECNPTSTHNSTKNNWNKDLPGIPQSYHQQKTDYAAEKGVFIFHLFGYEWSHKQDIIKSMLKNLISKSERRIFARNTEIVELSYNECNEFLNANHRQGECTSSIRYGLLHDDELVAVMSFSKPRRTIGNQSEDWELLRFCSKLGTNVIGGASKLSKHFIDSHPNQSVISFSDKARTRGNLYSQLGFKHIRDSEPGYVWVDEKTDKAYSRVRAQKSNIQKLLNDPELDLSKSENYNMTTHGFVRVFDSGTAVWVYIM